MSVRWSTSSATIVIAMGCATMSRKNDFTDCAGVVMVAVTNGDRMEIEAWAVRSGDADVMLGSVTPGQRVEFSAPTGTRYVIARTPLSGGRAGPMPDGQKVRVTTRCL